MTPSAAEPEYTPAGAALTDLVLTLFPVHGQVVAAAEELARPAGLTTARWQVLGAVLHEPLTVSGVARAMGLTRQSVQRLADVLVDQGLAEYRPNPAHRTAKLLIATEAGLSAVRAIHEPQVAWANRVTAEIDAGALRDAVDVLRQLSAAL